jgi:hypothetical protein
MSQDLSNYDVPIELAFDITKASGQMKFLGLSERPSESGNELTGLFDWTCLACQAANQDSVVLRPQQVFFAKWTCSQCSRVTLVRFRARAVAEWIAQHTVAVTGKSIDAPVEDKLAASLAASRGKQRQRSSHMVYAWAAVPMLAVIILMAVLDMRRVTNSSASPHDSPSAAASRTGQQQPPSAPSARIVGYWLSERRDHVLCFTAVDPDTREGTYGVVSRGDKKAQTVRFKVLHEETEGEQLVIRKEGVSGERLVVKHNGARVTYRLQSEVPEVTFEVAKDGKSMTRMEIIDGEPVVTTYSNAGEAEHP